MTKAKTTKVRTRMCDACGGRGWFIRKPKASQVCPSLGVCKCDTCDAFASDEAADAHVYPLLSTWWKRAPKHPLAIVSERPGPGDDPDGPNWRVYVHIEGYPTFPAIGYCYAATAEEAVGIVISNWKPKDWDSDAFSNHDGQMIDVGSSLWADFQAGKARLVCDNVEQWED